MPQAQKKNSILDEYFALPENSRAEYIDGKIYNMAAPNRKHQELSLIITRQIDNCISNFHKDCHLYYAPFMVNLFGDESTFVEPDILVVCDKTKLSERGLEGAPDFVIEIVSDSSRKMDYQKKMLLYSEAGVKEYWIVDPDRERTTIYSQSSDFVPMIVPFNSLLKSEICSEVEIKIV